MELVVRELPELGLGSGGRRRSRRGRRRDVRGRLVRGLLPLRCGGDRRRAFPEEGCRACQRLPEAHAAGPADSLEVVLQPPGLLAVRLEGPVGMGETPGEILVLALELLRALLEGLLLGRPVPCPTISFYQAVVLPVKLLRIGDELLQDQLPRQVGIATFILVQGQLLRSVSRPASLGCGPGGPRRSAQPW